MWIQCLLDGAHHLQFQRLLVAHQFCLTQHADAVLGRDGALVRCHQIMHQPVHPGLVAGKGLVIVLGKNCMGRHVEVQVAIPQVPKNDQPRIGVGLANLPGRCFDEFTDARDRHRDVMLDVLAFVALRGGYVFAQRPQLFKLRQRLRHHCILHPPIGQCLGQHCFQSFLCRLLAVQAADFQQHVPGQGGIRR